jgi:hypothetical protein
MPYYRIVEIKNGKPYSLFHATGGSREIPTDRWVECDKKIVKDGSSTFTYPSGFHAIEGYENALHFFNTMFRVKENRYIVPCQLRGNIRPKHDKPMKRACVLADKIYIKSEDIERTLDEEREVFA